MQSIVFFKIKVIFCAFVFSGCGCARRCYDCVPISSCDSAAEYAARVAENDPGVSNETFQRGVCDFAGGQYKVCCSRFPVTQNRVSVTKPPPPVTNLRRCYDCVSISSCDSAAEYAARVAENDPGVSNETFQSGVCDFVGGQYKVCCSKFPVIQNRVSVIKRPPPVTNLRRCYDCVPISSCDSAAEYAARVAENDPGVSNETFQRGVCDFAGGQYKVCCSKFPVTRKRVSVTKPVTSLRRCFDCVPISSCESAADYAAKFTENDAAFQSGVCGITGDQYKVCCSKFPVTQDRAGVTKPPLPVSSLRSSGHDRITCSPALDSNETMALYEFQGLEPKVNSTDPIETHPNVRLLPSKCGTVDGIKIFNGKIAKLYELPWMALIAYETENGSEFHCAGSVINSRYILTAAHCVFNTEYSKYERITSVRIGEVNLQTPYDCQGVGANLICECIIQNINVEDIIPHENFGGLTSKQNDIALLRLSEPINFTRNAFPICLPVSSDLRNIGLEGKKAVVAGWGLTENYIKSNILLKIEIPIWSSRRCRKVWNRGNDDFKKLCAGGSIQDSCTGDSGGPLIVDSYYVGRRSYVQYGIISYGPKPCATVGIPGVYTYVDKYMQWILDNIRE